MKDSGTDLFELKAQQKEVKNEQAQDNKQPQDKKKSMRIRAARW